MARRGVPTFGVMKNSYRKFVGVLLALTVLCLFVACLWFGRPSEPKLSVTYIRTMDGHGHWKLQFGITNNGNSTVFTCKLGEIEVVNHTNSFTVGATSPREKLMPGEGQVVEAVLSESQMNSVDGKWRYICLYAPSGLRSRIYQWQWRPNGPGLRVNWLIPQWLKGLPLTAKGTTEWIEQAKP